MIPAPPRSSSPAIGLGIVLVGIWLVSNVWKTPTYNLILSWDADALPVDWEAGRRRYFTINWIQATCSVRAVPVA
jgi:hypothetical protein